MAMTIEPLGETPRGRRAGLVDPSSPRFALDAHEILCRAELTLA